jgi:hypothetical protein
MQPVRWYEVAGQLVGVEEVDLAQQERVVLLGDPPPAAVDIQHPRLIQVVPVLEPLPVLDRPGLPQVSRPKDTPGVVG